MVVAELIVLGISEGVGQLDPKESRKVDRAVIGLARELGMPPARKTLAPGARVRVLEEIVDRLRHEGLTVLAAEMALLATAAALPPDSKSR